jgi:hypothetical protein
MQGRVKDIGVQARDPKTDMNLSREFPSERQKITVNRTRRVLLRFLSHCRFFVFPIPLNK